MTAVVLLLCPPLTYLAFATVRAYRDAPRMIARIERSGALVLALDEFPPGFLDALIIVEDPRFYRHPGVDLLTPGAGFTTITQALVEQLYSDNFRSAALRFLRFSRVKQTLLALAFDARVAKREQLRIFVNRVYLGAPAGQPVNGFGAGARVYFDKDWRALSRAEFLALVAAIAAPNELDPARHATANATRVRRIERLLRGECRPAALDDVYYRRCE